jgi:hypothetical protein
VIITNGEGHMNKRNMGIFVATALISGSVFTAGLASAWETRRAGGYCSAGTSAASYDYTGHNFSSFTLPVGCAMPDESDLMHPQITHLNLHVDVPSSSPASAFRCVNFWNATGGTCGDSAFSPSSPGTFVVSPPNTPASFAANWNNAAHFGFAVVLIPPGGTLKGMYTSNL